MTARGAAAALALTLVATGCAGGSRPSEPPPAEVVTTAQRAIRDAGAGHVTAHQLGRGRGEAIATWESNYDLRRRLWNAVLVTDEDGESGRTMFVGAGTRTYLRPADVRDRMSDRWASYEDPRLGAGTQPHLAAVLAFRSGGAMHREPDGWSVDGTVPMRVALVAVGVVWAGTPLRNKLVEAATGTAPATLVLGPDRRIRELRMHGGAFDVTSLVARETRTALAAASVTIDVSRVGGDVALEEAPPAAEVDEGELWPEEKA